MSTLPHLSLTGLDWTIGGIALLANIALGLYLRCGPGKGSSDDFFLAGRRLTWPIIGASLLATNIGAEHMVGLCGDAYRYGFCAGTNEMTAGISLVIAAAILVPYYLKNRVFTIPEFLELRYRKEARLFFSAMMLLICVVTKMAFCLYAGALVIQASLGWDIMPTVVAWPRDGDHHHGRGLRRGGLYRRHPYADHDRRFGRWC